MIRKSIVIIVTLIFILEFDACSLFKKPEFPPTQQIKKAISESTSPEQKKLAAANFKLTIVPSLGIQLGTNLIVDKGGTNTNYLINMITNVKIETIISIATNLSNNSVFLASNLVTNTSYLLNTNTSVSVTAPQTPTNIYETPYWTEVFNAQGGIAADDYKKYKSTIDTLPVYGGILAACGISLIPLSVYQKQLGETGYYTMWGVGVVGLISTGIMIYNLNNAGYDLKNAVQEYNKEIDKEFGQTVTYLPQLSQKDMSLNFEATKNIVNAPIVAVRF